MRIAYLDTASGIAGDMMLAALVDAGADAETIEKRIRSVGLAEVKLEFRETRRCGFRSIQLHVRHPVVQTQRNLNAIVNMIEGGQLEPREEEVALRIFRKLGQAEARVHGMPIEAVHFHEVGCVDSIADIVGVAVGLNLLGIQRILSAPPALGTGSVQIAHGIVSVPAPATAELLRGLPMRGSVVNAELTTPTGAAILATLCDEFGAMPGMRVEAIGCGAGHRELPHQPNILRIFVGQLLDRQPEAQAVESVQGYDHSHDHSHDHHHH